MNIGWPEGIWITLTLLGLTVHAVNHGKPRDSYNFPLSLTGVIVSTLLLWLGGFFA